MILAVKAESINCYRILQDGGADPLVTSLAGETGLHVASEHCLFVMLEFLLGIDASVSSQRR
eukprot:m.208421 g.208421  ORF g.208421 m.208421 type:complete len:62 (+) comp53931_c0_seq2:2-187(+)